MASSSISPPNVSFRVGRTETSHSLSSSSPFSSSSSSSFSFISVRKKKVNNGGVRIQSALHSPSVLHFPKQNFKENSVNLNSHQSPKWNILQRALSTALDMAEKLLISRKLKNPLPKTSDPQVQLAGNFAPVPEQPVRQLLPITGKIPNCIDGVYLRNGANPLFEPIVDHHFFDGDGMIHAVKIKSGKASYACRFTETQRLVQEREIGRPIFPKVIGELLGHSGIFRLLLFYARSLFDLVDRRHGCGVANAGIVYFNRRLLAISEDDLPYHVHISASGDLTTIGQYDFDDQLKSAMIAHPKIDPDSGELLALSYNVVTKPYLKFFRFSHDGKKSLDVEIPLKVPIMMHDFAITEKFVVIPDQQIIFKLQEMIKGGSPVIYDKTKKSRFGILPKNARDSKSIIWVDSPEETFCFHLWNAWEESDSDEVVVIGSCMTPADSIFNECDESLKIVLSEIRLNLKSGESSRRPILSDSEQMNLEAGMVNKNLLGKKTQFAYLAIAEPWPKVLGFAKVDLFSGKLRKYIYGDRKFGGEPFFLPRDGNSEKEDDGYILCFVHDEETGKSELQIINAIDLELEASVKLPTRVPYGFHGTFVDSASLENQASADD